MSEDAANLKIRKPKLFLLLMVVVVLVLLSVAYGLKNPGRGELDLCQEKCAKSNRWGRLVPAIKNQPAKPGAYIGPWTCVCE